MITIEGAIWERILSISDVVAIAGQRVHQVKLPQSPIYPAVRIQLIDEVPSYHARGENNLTPSRVQVDAFGQEASGYPAYVWANRLAQAINGQWTQGSPAPPTGLSGWRGSFGGSPPALRIDFIRRIDRSVSYVPLELRVVTVRQDFLVWWKPV